jgi:CHAT domain
MENMSNEHQTSDDNSSIELLIRFLQVPQEETEKILAAQPETVLDKMLIMIRHRLALLEQVHERKVQARTQRKATTSHDVRSQSEPPSSARTSTASSSFVLDDQFLTRLFQIMPEDQLKHVFQDISSIRPEYIEDALRVLQRTWSLSDEQVALLRQGFEGLRQDAREGGYEMLQDVMGQLSPEQLDEFSRLVAREINTGRRQNVTPPPGEERERRQNVTPPPPRLEQHFVGDLQALLARESQSLTTSQRTLLGEISREAGRSDPGKLIDLLAKVLENFARLPVPCLRVSLYLQRAGASLNILQGAPALQPSASPFLESGLDDCNKALAIPLPEAARLLHTNAHLLRGAFYANRLTGIHQDNLKQALADFDIALQQISYAIQPEIWTKVSASRALVRFELCKGGSRQELEKLALELETILLKYFPLGTKGGEVRSLLKAAEAQTYLQLYIFHTGDTRQTLEQIIQSCNEALHSLTRERNPYEWAALHQTRGYAHINRSQGHLEENLALAIENCQKALQVFMRENRPYEWAMTHFTLSYAYSRRVTGGPTENLRLSIDHCNASLQVLTAETYPTEWRHVMSHYYTVRQELSSSNKMYPWKQEKPFVEEILKDQHAPEGSVAWANLQVSQGDALADQQDPASKEQAIKHYDQALSVFTFEATPLLRATTLLRRAMAKHRLRPPALEEIFRTNGGPFQALVGRFPSELLANVATYRRYQDEAIADLEAALTVLTREDTPREWAVAHSELAAIYTAYVWGDNQEKISNHIDAAQSVFTREGTPGVWAVQQVSRGNNLLFRSPNSLSEQEVQEVLGSFDDALAIFTQRASPVEHCQIQLRRILVLEYLERWEDVHKAFLSVREVQRDLVATAIDESNRSEAIEGVTSDHIYVRDAQALLLMEPPDPIEALIALEEGRAQSMRVALEIDSSTLQKPQLRKPDAQKRFDAFFQACQKWSAHQLQTGESFAPNLAAPEEYQQHRQRLQLLQSTYEEFVQTRATIRQYDDPDFMAPVPTLEGIARALAGPDEALVYLVAGLYLPNRFQSVKRSKALPGSEPGFALIVTRNIDGSPHVQALPLPALQSNAIDTLLEPVSDAAIEGGEPAEVVPGSRRESVRLDEALETLGGLGLNELATALLACEVRVRKAMLVPYERMGLFPLAAVSIQVPERPVCRFGDLFDELTFVPNARAAEIARSRADALEKKRQSFLFGGNPQPLAVGTDLPSSPLPFAEDEAVALYYFARRISGYPPKDLHYLPPYEMKKEQVIAKLQTVTCAYLALHSLYRPEKARSSVLILAGTQETPEEKRTISLGEVLDGKIDLHNLRLLVLSACETSIFDLRQLPNEVLGLAAGFLQAGVAGVVASLWKVDEKATYLLMTRFARFYLDSQGLWSPAQALTLAQRWLREEATNAVLQDYDPLSSSDAPETKHILSEGKHSHLSALELIRKEAKERANEEPDELFYADPFYWAGFVVTGC